ncbi:MAG: UvrD-helicase domain-containing protein [Limnochordia bacterium]|nr:AAA family ATPase [Bacillota bacterium]
MSSFTVAISADFFTAFASLPRQQQARVRDFITKFRANPRSPGINYEKLQNAYDSNMYSVRIDDTYRGIVVRQDGSGVYLLLWVDHHDRAYDWACRKRCRVHPTTGTVQVFDVQETVVAATDQIDANKALFGHVTDEQLLRLGVPSEKLPETRALMTLEDLYQRKASYPEDAYEGLEWVANGFDVEEVLDTLYEDTSADGEISTDDFAKALSKPGSLMTFAVVEGEEELQAILDAPLERWRVFLHPTQRKIVTRHYNGPARVTGGAGTGKTVVAMHRTRWLAGQLEGDQKILFTTFTANLAEDIQDNLRKICSVDEMRRIEVIHLDLWVARFLQEQDYNCRVIYGEELDSLWSSAVALAGQSLDLPMEFFQDEWSKVVQAQEAFTREDYLRASRRGRGVRLDRRKRIAVWKVFEAFKNLCHEQRIRDVEMAMYECRQIIRRRFEEPLYASIVVDEGQDLSMSAYRLLRAMAGEERPNDLFIVGDAHQRIYRNQAVLSHCGVNVRGRSSHLRISYRTTEEIRKWAFRLLKGISFDDLDGGSDDGRVCLSLTHGPEPVVRDFESLDSEFAYLLGEIRRLEAQGTSLRDICVVARTNRLLDEYVRRFLQAGVRTYEIKRSKLDDRSFDGVRLATMHRVKGLEFDHVFVVAANKDIIPHPRAIAYHDEVSLMESMTRERCLLYVALTRAKKSAHITSYGSISEFVAEIMAPQGT